MNVVGDCLDQVPNISSHCYTPNHPQQQEPPSSKPQTHQAGVGPIDSHRKAVAFLTIGTEQTPPRHRPAFVCYRATTHLDHARQPSGGSRNSHLCVARCWAKHRADRQLAWHFGAAKVGCDPPCRLRVCRSTVYSSRLQRAGMPPRGWIGGR